MRTPSNQVTGRAKDETCGGHRTRLVSRESQSSYRIAFLIDSWANEGWEGQEGQEGELGQLGDLVSKGWARPNLYLLSGALLVRKWF